MSACSTPAPPPPLTAWQNIPDRAPLHFEAVPVPPPAQAEACVVDGEEKVCYSLPEAKKLLDRTIALKANSDMLPEVIAAVGELEAAIDGYVQAGRLTEERANWLQAEIAQANAELRDEKRLHLADNVLHRLIMLAGIAAALAF